MSDSSKDIAERWFNKHMSHPVFYEGARHSFAELLDKTRAQGRQEGFAEAQERAASLVDMAPVKPSSVEETARAIRALQPTNEDGG